MKHIILSKDQLKGKLCVELCSTKDIAYNRRKMLLNTYNDVVVLSEDDYKFIASTSIKNTIKNQQLDDFYACISPDPIWNGPSEDLVGDEEALAPQCFHEDEEGDEYYLNSNGFHYYLLEKTITLKGNRQQTIYVFGKKGWRISADLKLLKYSDIPHDKKVIESPKTGVPFLKSK